MSIISERTVFDHFIISLGILILFLRFLLLMCVCLCTGAHGFQKRELGL